MALASLVAACLYEMANGSETTIGSTSLCGDSYLMALAPTQITALSWQSRSPLSRAGQAQRALPQLWDELEVLSTSRADYILFGSGEGQSVKSLNPKYLHLKWGESFASVIDNADLISQNLNVDDIVKTE